MKQIPQIILCVRGDDHCDGHVVQMKTCRNDLDRVKGTLRHMDFEEHYLFSGHNKYRYYTRDSRSRSNKTQRKPEVYNA